MADLPSRTLVIVAGDDRPLVWQLRDADGELVNLTGYSARAQVRERTDSPDVLHEWSTSTATAVLGDSTLSLKVTDSDTWTWRRGVYDIRVTDPAGTTEVIDRGPVVITPAVTR